MVKGWELVKKNIPGISKKHYKTNVSVYHILFETHEKIIVNGLESESLDPNHPIALKYISKKKNENQ